MKIVDVLKIRKYLLLAVLSSLIFTSIYVYTQVLGILDNLDLWVTVIPWYNAILFSIFAPLFGIALSFQVYNWKQPKMCSIGGKAKSAGASSSATLLGLFVAQCPACASLGALLLPASVFTAVFVKYSTVINLIGIGLLLFTIHYLGGFKKTEQTQDVQMQS